MIAWIRYKHRIPAPELKRPEELTVAEVAEKLDVSPGVVYYWIGRGVVSARRRNQGSALWIALDPDTEHRLRQWTDQSTRIQKSRSQQPQRLLLWSALCLHRRHPESMRKFLDVQGTKIEP